MCEDMSLFVFQLLDEGNCLLYLYCTGCANKSTRLTLPNGEKKSEPCFAPAARRVQGVNGNDIHFQMFLGVVIPKLTACWLFQVQTVPPPPLRHMCEDMSLFVFQLLDEGNCLLYLYCTGCANKSTRLTLPNGEKKSEPCFAPAARRVQGVNIFLYSSEHPLVSFSHSLQSG